MLARSQEHTPAYLRLQVGSGAGDGWRESGADSVTEAAGSWVSPPCDCPTALPQEEGSQGEPERDMVFGQTVTMPDLPCKH